MRQRQRRRSGIMRLGFEHLEDRRLLATIQWTGDIPDGTTWRAGDIQHLTADVRIPAGSTLTIEPGALIKFGAVDVDLVVAGTLHALGTAQQNILFTSVRDDTGGDTNGDGSSACCSARPGRGNWGQIDVITGGVADFEYTHIRYGGHDRGGQLTATSGTLSVSNSIISDSETNGVRLNHANPTLTDNVYRDNGDAAIGMDHLSDPVIHGVTTNKNVVNGLKIDAGTLSQDRVWNNPDIVYVTAGDILVPIDTKLRVEAGQIVKFGAANFNLFVEGTLEADGTAAAPVVFTDIKDDVIGGDTNNDRSDTSPAPGHWGRIELSGVDNLLRHVDIRYGGNNSVAQLRLNAGEASISDSVLRLASGDGLRIENSHPTLTNVSFRNNTNAAASMDLLSNPTFINSGSLLAVGNAINALQVDAGAIDADTVWDDPAIPYWTDGDILVREGATLTLAPGQIIKFGSIDYDLFVNGTLDAQGTALAPIVFTASKDDTGGDSNNDGTFSGPQAGNWGHIELNGPGNVLSHVDVRFGGDHSSAELLVTGGTLTLSDSTLRSSSSDAIRVQNSNPALSRNTFLDNQDAAISMDLNSNPAISGFSATHNRINGLQVDGGTLSRDGFWNDPDIVYWTDGDIIVAPGVKLTIEAGQVIKFGGPQFDLLVNGTLDVRGTDLAPIVFTESRDDSAGGDTNNNGTSSGPAPNNWGRIELTGPSNVMSHVQLRYGGNSALAQLLVNGGELALSNSAVNQSSSDGLRTQNSNPSLENVTLADNIDAAISMDLNSNPSVTGLTLLNNTINGLQVDGGTLSADGFWNDPEIVYWLDGDITVPADTMLTITPGQYIKFAASDVDLFVRGKLNARGTAAAAIVFTAASDDGAGGDTNGDRDATSPARGDWGRIEFTGNDNVLEHVDLKYGGSASAAIVQALSGVVLLVESLIQQSAAAGLRLDTSTATIAGVEFRDNTGAAISLDLESDLDLSHGILAHNGVNGAALDAGTLPCNAHWDNPDIAYRLTGDVIVPENVTLEIAPGQIVKARRGVGDELRVDGTLHARGTAASPVIFTSEQDDSAGGDTDNNDITFGLNGSWDGLRFTSGSQGNTLDHVEVRFAGANGMGAVASTGAPVTISNSIVRNSSTNGIWGSEASQLNVVSAIVAQNADRGIVALSGTALHAVNSTIDGNAGGVSANASTVEMVNNLVTNHRRVGIFVDNGATVVARSNIVFNPTASAGNYDGLADPTGLNGNLSVDPLYGDRTLLDFELGIESPAIDSAASDAAPALDFRRRSRVDNPKVPNTGTGAVRFVDRGALEWQFNSGGAHDPSDDGGEANDGLTVTDFPTPPENSSNWTHEFDPWDVNNDGFIAPLDALVGINDLNANGPRRLPPDHPSEFAFLDVNGDGFSSPQDVLLVINQLNLGEASSVIALGEPDGFYREDTRFIELGQASGTRTLRIEVKTAFNFTDEQPVLEDALLLYLVDPTDSHHTYLDRGESGTTFFAMVGHDAQYSPEHVRFDGRFVEVDLSSVSQSPRGRLIVQFLNNDADVGGQAYVRLAGNDVDPQGTPQTPFEPTGETPEANAESSDDNGPLQILIDNVRFQSTVGQFEADLRVRNNGPAIGRQVDVVFPHLQDGVTFASASGNTAEGEPYVAMRDTMPFEGLDAGAISAPVKITLNVQSGASPILLPVTMLTLRNQPGLCASPVSSVSGEGEASFASLSRATVDHLYADNQSFTDLLLGEPLPGRANGVGTERV